MFSFRISPTGPSSIPIPGGIVMLAVWGVVAVIAAALAVTYARIPVADLYNVSQTGLAGGAGRVLVYLNYPVAFIAIGLVAFAAVRLWGSSIGTSASGRSAIITASVAAIALSAVAGFPGVVDQGNLDARLVNVIPALGVAIAISMTIVSLRVSGLGSDAGWSTGDRIRLVLTAIVLFLSLPWLFAYAGFHLTNVPGLGAIFMSEQVPAGETIPAVHLGDHHGMSGTMFFLAGLWLSREIRHFGPTASRWATASYVSLMMSYGIFNAAQDFWLEQIVKRGWVTTEIPNVTRPGLSIIWGLILLATVALTVFFIWNARREPNVEIGVPDRAPSDLHGSGTGDMSRDHVKGSRQSITWSETDQ
jgi:hypothetical protein